jgi:hypothetical protein
MAIVSQTPDTDRVCLITNKAHVIICLLLHTYFLHHLGDLVKLNQQKL